VQGDVVNAVGSRGEIIVDGVTKTFGDLKAVDDVTIEIPGGEFFSMLGPSGCGKTTTLRMIAGFEEPDSGRIILEGKDVSFVPPAKRNVNMVFQAYGLFPHMTVKENVAFGLKVKHTPKAETNERVAEALGIVRMEEYASRRPSQMSGGQQQRVALARALVNRPAALLLDEPLGALDLKLRKEMQLELRRLHATTGTTFVYVTHDQEEALTMSQRIAVMKDGLVQQVATPRELYESPCSAFVAGFIGTSNILSFVPDSWRDGTAIMNLEGGDRICGFECAGQPAARIIVRPEKMRIWGEADGEQLSRVGGKISEVVYLGSMTQLIVRLATGESVTIHELNDDLKGALPAIGDSVVVTWAAESSFILRDDADLSAPLAVSG
jgi:spermidine/putrescine transport system ATP-binding protein